MDELKTHQVDAEDVSKALEVLKATEERLVKLTREEIWVLMDTLRPPTQAQTLIVAPDRLEALGQLVPEMDKAGIAVRYHGEILGNVAVFSARAFPRGLFRVVSQEGLEIFLRNLQLTLPGLSGATANDGQPPELRSFEANPEC